MPTDKELEDFKKEFDKEISKIFPWSVPLVTTGSNISSNAYEELVKSIMAKKEADEKVKLAKDNFKKSEDALAEIDAKNAENKKKSKRFRLLHAKTDRLLAVWCLAFGALDPLSIGGLLNIFIGVAIFYKGCDSLIKLTKRGSE